MNQRIDKPWGFEIIWALTDNYAAKLLHINAGYQLSKQYHQVKEESLYVLKGALYNYDADNKITRINPGESFHVSPHQVHRFGAPMGTVEVIEVSTPHLDDVVRLADDYGRQS